MKIKYVANAVLWFDKINGNTYHSVNITNAKNGKVIFCQFQYGYGNQFQYTAFAEMIKSKWIKGYSANELTKYQIENNYPIMWNQSNGKKQECIANGKE